MNKELFLQAFMDDVWNHQRIDKIKDYIHPEYTIHIDSADPWEGKTLSHDDFKKRLQFSFDSFPDIHFEISLLIEEENHVATSWILTGTNRGKIGAYAPTNKLIKTKGITIYHFKDNLINGHTQVFDRHAVINQLGF